MTRGPKVRVPSNAAAAGDGVRLGRVGLVAVFGFAIGIVWPRLAGISLVPSAPVEGARQEALAASDAITAQEEGGSAEGSGETPAEPEPPSPAERLVIDEFQVTSCRDDQGKSVSDCGELEAESLLAKPLRAVATCPAAESAVGRLSVGMDVDFKARKVSGVKSGKSTDLSSAVARELLACIERQLEHVRWGGVKAEHASYTVFALMELRSPQQVAAEAIVPASGSATVRWNVALIRRGADSSAKVRARLTSGTRVIVTARQGEWYRVKYDAKGGEGWVHGAAIGMDVTGQDAPHSGDQAR